MMQTKNLLQQHCHKGGWSAEVLKEEATANSNGGMMEFINGILTATQGETIEKVNEVDPGDVLEEMKEFRKMIKSEHNSKTVPFWDVPMELLKILVNPNTVYRIVPWGLGAEHKFHEPQ